MSRVTSKIRFVTLLAILSAVLCAAPRTEIGELNGAKFRIDVPENWNGGLVVYCHGYNPVAVSYEDKPMPLLGVFVGQGYAVAQSGYAAGGWAIQEAVQDTEALRRYFSGKYGAPKETYVTGHSMGGFLTMLLLERFPNSYDAGLALCGPLAPATWFFERRTFDMLVVFDYYFPGALPNPANVPKDFQMSKELNAATTALLDGKPDRAEIVRNYTGIKTNAQLADTVVFFTYILKDLQQRGGGNPFDNRSTIYSGTSDDNALNDGVKRYAAEPRAAEYVRTYYTATGHLTRPMLAIHTTYDPLVPPWVPNNYATLAGNSGSSDMFVQQYVKRDGHCAINGAETARGFAQLREWKTRGVKPAAASANP